MILKAQVYWQMDTAFPRDRLMITPHFSVDGAWIPGEFDPTSLANDLAAAIDAWTIPACEIGVRIYDAQGAKPNFPLAEKVVAKGIVGTSTVPRELALCLSYYSERNVPRRRGRLYVPLAVATSGNTVGNRPSQANIDNVLGLRTSLQNLGGANVDWVVYSRRAGAAYTASHAWVDNEWDIQRRRGLTGSQRTQATTGE